MFKKSSRCAADKPQCVEVEIRDLNVVVRNSNFPAFEVFFDHDEWAVFVEGVKAGEFDVTPAPVAV